MNYSDKTTAIELKDYLQGPSAFSSAEINLQEFIDLERFPIHDLADPERQKLVAQCRQSLTDSGCVVVSNFILDSATELMREEACRLMPYANATASSTNPYFTADDPSLPVGHPKRFFEDRTSSYINSDILEPQSILRKIYDSDVVLHFIAECLDIAPIYRWADPLGRNPYSVMDDGDYFPWHFDANNFTVSILVQESQSGGDFEYCQDIREPDNENFEAVKSILNGERDRVKTLTLKRGDMQIFKGRYSMHRVTKTYGPEPRIIALPTYVTNPYSVNRPQHSKILYGRVMPIHEERNLARMDKLMD
ncbi:MAG: HalD/BesD family halogenase [Arenicella sp.]